MGTFSDQAFYGNDAVRVMASITEHLATTAKVDAGQHQATQAKAEAQIQALTSAGQTPPADLDAKTEAFVQSVRDRYQAAADEITERLALPAPVRAALGVSDERLTAAKATAEQWLLSIDAMWTPGGEG